MIDELTPEMLEGLHAPFDVRQVDLKPGATTKDKTAGNCKALALAYVEIRAYQARLDAIIGAANWAVAYRPLGPGAIIATVTLFGVAKEDVGECAEGDPNRATSALAQAFKRACSAWGLGRYLYDLPSPWVDYDDARKRFVPEVVNVVRQIYEQAGLLAPAPQRREATPAQRPAAAARPVAGGREYR